MKKIISWIIFFSLISCTLFSACEGDNRFDFEQEKKPKKTIKIAYLANGNLKDKNIFESALEGLKTIKKNYGAKVMAVEIGEDESKFVQALTDASKEDYDLIVVGTANMEKALMEVAPQFPDNRYIMFDHAIDFTKGNFDNVYCITYKDNEGAYLCGFLAASMSKTNILGFVGGLDIPVVNNMLVGFIQGAKDAKSDIKIFISYVESFNDPKKGKEIALSQYNKGVDIMYSCAGFSGVGCIDAAKETRKYIICTDIDQEETYKKNDTEKAKLILTSQIKRVDKSLASALDLMQKENLQFGQIKTLGIKEDYIMLADDGNYKNVVSKEIREEVENKKHRIIDGTIKVQSVYGLSEEELKRAKELVKPEVND